MNLCRILEKPSYGFQKNETFYKPSNREIWREFFSRINFLKSEKNWIGFFSWFTSLILALPLVIFFIYFFSFKLLIAGFLYGMVGLGSFGTFWYHRYATHKAFTFRNSCARNICRNLFIKAIPDEVYVLSHHVHHQICEKPGDPYNVHGGWLYCFLADVNHQGLNKNLDFKNYALCCKLMAHTGVKANSFEKYQKWGTVCHPAFTFLHYALNWTFWYAVFYFIGGNALATALFGAAGIWSVGVRTYNFEGHGKGKDLKRAGIDFNLKDFSINRMWPGLVAGEWHNNHHLFPTGARSGFLKHQLDLPWFGIRILHKLGVVSSFKDYKRDFIAFRSAQNIQLRR